MGAPRGRLLEGVWILPLRLTLGPSLAWGQMAEGHTLRTEYFSGQSVALLALKCGSLHLWLGHLLSTPHVVWQQRKPWS